MHRDAPDCWNCSLRIFVEATRFATVVGHRMKEEFLKRFETKEKLESSLRGAPLPSLAVCEVSASFLGVKSYDVAIRIAYHVGWS